MSGTRTSQRGTAQLCTAQPDTVALDTSRRRHTGGHTRWPARCVWLFTLIAAGCSSNDGTVIESRTVATPDGNRSYSAFVPDSYRAGEAGLVVAFHGVPDNGANFRDGTKLDRLAESTGWIIAYPTAAPSAGDWAEGCNGCAKADRDGIDDVGFVVRLVADVFAQFPFDTTRVAAVGFSQGGLFVHRLACDAADRLFATAVVAATMSRPLSQVCSAPAPVPMMLLHGMDDAVFPWAGGGQGNFITISAEAAVGVWATQNGCGGVVMESDPSEIASQAVDRWRAVSCSNGVETVLYGMENTGHVWPHDFQVLDIIESFLRRQPGFGGG